MVFRLTKLWIALGLLVGIWGLSAVRRTDPRAWVRPVGAPRGPVKILQFYASVGMLKVGDKAPDFSTNGAVGGKDFKLHLADQLKKGPVVLYFFPKAFTSGCTAEAHAFSSAIGDFKKAGAQVIGMSADNVQTLHDFSTKECRSAFPVATAIPSQSFSTDARTWIPSTPHRMRLAIAPIRRERMASVARPV